MNEPKRTRLPYAGPEEMARSSVALYPARRSSRNTRGTGDRAGARAARYAAEKQEQVDHALRQITMGNRRSTAGNKSQKRTRAFFAGNGPSMYRPGTFVQG